ncbi:Arabinose efflux permease [Enterobacter asburiae]|uniref:Arabinose efflux permease n=1 Tax=Enterobacter asburiae TaxID=61645 RepID=A0A376F1I4_ENTAS|nr:Arabinose efflux permease [Enterobacter asburiae]
MLWGAGPHFWELIAGVQLFFLAFNLMEALLPSLISKESPPGIKVPRWASTPPASFSAWRSAARSGGWVDGLFDSQTVFLAGALLATVWLLVASTMKEPRYVSSLRVEIPDDVEISDMLKQRLEAKEGVTEVLIVPEERSAYVKIDSKMTNRFEVEQALKA